MSSGSSPKTEMCMPIRLELAEDPQDRPVHTAVYRALQVSKLLGF